MLSRGCHPDKKKQTIQWKWGVSIPLPLACKASALPSELHSLTIDEATSLLTPDATMCCSTPDRCEDSVAEWSKAIDLKSIILRMRRFKSCHCRFLFQPRADFCVSDVVDVDEQSKQDNVAEWLRRLPAKEFPFGA